MMSCAHAHWLALSSAGNVSCSYMSHGLSVSPPHLPKKEHVARAHVDVFMRFFVTTVPKLNSQSY